MILNVGIMHSEEIFFEIPGAGKGRESVGIRDGRLFYEGKSYDRLRIQGSPFRLYGVTIGVDFHWQRKLDQEFAGNLSFIMEDGMVTAVNEIDVEDYLLSVISSEMKSTATLEYLKAHAVISRSWVMNRILSRGGESGDCIREYELPDGTPVLLKWWDRENHRNFDVCADDHCQRYQGLTMAVGENVRKAIGQTRGLVLKYNGKICDARFSKCCGGRMEIFSSCWDDIDHPYLQSLPDGEGKAFCDTSDKRILSRVLNDYDLETGDFFSWEVRYTRKELSEIIRDRTGIDFGEVRSLTPMEYGPSGRIKLLRIEGSARTMAIGKELFIRRALSRSHLKSSAFDVEVSGDSFTLKGRGWGHGVGFCQIGAAVMADKGYDYRQILEHYYPGAEIAKADE